MTINFWLFTVLTLALVAFIGYGTYATARLLRNWRPDRNLLLLPAENLLRLVLIGVCIILVEWSAVQRAGVAHSPSRATVALGRSLGGGAGALLL